MDRFVKEILRRWNLQNFIENVEGKFITFAVLKCLSLFLLHVRLVFISHFKIRVSYVAHLAF